MDMQTQKYVNDLDLEALQDVVEAVTKDPREGVVGFSVRTEWGGQTRSVSHVDHYTLGGKRHDRSFTIRTDEPFELLGENSAPNPQETLMAALNGCMLVGYVAGAALRGITLESLEIESKGALDLRGFLGLDENVKPGYERIEYTVSIKGNGTAEDFRDIHETVMKTSPNYFNLTAPVELVADLKIME